jgi:branched-chain amino acid transport system ATP-binding protein
MSDTTSGEAAVDAALGASASGRPATADALHVEGLYTGYGRKQVVFDLNLRVGEGEIVTLLGHNGSGKSTTIKTILGVLPPQGGRIWYHGRDVTGRGTRLNVKEGMALIPSERFVFADLSVLDNLLLGSANTADASRRPARLEQVYELFPILRERGTQLAGTLSGGQQRMLSLGLALMGSPKLLMLDEPSLGLAPRVVESIFDAVRHLAETEGLSVLLLEQNVAQALRIVDRVYVMRSGRIILDETVEQMRARGTYWDLF